MLKRKGTGMAYKKERLSRRDFFKYFIVIGCSAGCFANEILVDNAIADTVDGELYINENLTFGDVMRATNPDLYNELPEVARAIADSTVFGTENSYTGYQAREKAQSVFGTGALTAKLDGSDSIYYSAFFETTALCPKTSLQVLIKRSSNGLVVTNHISLGSYDSVIEVHGSKDGLDPGDYIVSATGTIVTPPPGDYIIALPPAYAQKLITVPHR